MGQNSDSASGKRIIEMGTSRRDSGLIPSSAWLISLVYRSMTDMSVKRVKIEPNKNLIRIRIGLNGPGGERDAFEWSDHPGAITQAGGEIFLPSEKRLAGKTTPRGGRFG